VSATKLPDEGRLPSFGRATGWLNSESLTPEHLRGRVVLVDFWTFTCVNWLRTLPYLRAWYRKYADAGLVIVGVHTPEFGFEANPENVAAHARELGVEYPIALDANYGVWDEFANGYWPAAYLADAKGHIRYHHYGESEYPQTERAIQRLLIDAGAPNIDSGLVAPEPTGLEVAAD
jgi:thiol-disulfide isomerase/thioredoxin